MQKTQLSPSGYFLFLKLVMENRGREAESVLTPSGLQFHLTAKVLRVVTDQESLAIWLHGITDPRRTSDFCTRKMTASCTLSVRSEIMYIPASKCVNSHSVLCCLLFIPAIMPEEHSVKPFVCVIQMVACCSLQDLTKTIKPLQYTKLPILS